MHIYGEEDRAFLLQIVQCCVNEAKSRPRLAKLADGQLK